jgi:2-dehydro-3-deoxygluconokinase
LSIDDVDRALVRTPRILHLSGVTPALSASCRQAVHHALRQARAVGVLTSFDVNYWPALWKPADCADELRELSDAAHVTFVGLDEATTDHFQLTADVREIEQWAAGTDPW